MLNVPLVFLSSFMMRLISLPLSENENLEYRLATQRQLYVSNEETMRARDLEHRGLKAKIMNAELQIREKDNIIGRLTVRLCLVRNQSIFFTKMTYHGYDFYVLDLSLNRAGQKLCVRKHPRWLPKSRSSAQLEKQWNKRRKLSRKMLEYFRRSVRCSPHSWPKPKQNTTKKSSEVSQRLVLEEKISQLQQDHDMLLSRNNSLLTETDRLRLEKSFREELRMSNYRFDQLTLKLSKSEKSLESVNQSNKDLTQQILTFRKDKDEWGRLEREMREELVVLRKDRLVLTSEVEELKRKLVRTEIERKEVDGLRARLDREVTSLKKHVEALEEDKSRTEAAIRNTMSERRAIDKSLAAMEKENTELYRNCAQLQSQIAQLERDSGPNTIAKMLKDQKELEGRMTKLVVEKQQLEMVIEQKEMNFSQERETMVSQLGTLRDQLEMEKKRRLDLQKEVRAAERTVVPERQFSRTSGIHITRSKSIQRRSNPFRV
ncbi:unnamed protein product [Angiostrongylus costaricensis]|uniref:Myosin_tail_1 domain-containing protein n=1 Tax=Angiostrongylus costaricensis TaxID=334426 RepID=A0A0R3PYQ0_ANGCS|nr:unnamed protein product [Angiostrongylus costaricensis]